MYCEYYQIMAEDKEEIIKELHSNIGKLKELYEKGKSNYALLMKEKAELSDQLLQKNKEVESLEVKMNTLKLAKSISGTNNDMHDAKIKVSNLVREIDKCIALLNR